MLIYKVLAISLTRRSALAIALLFGTASPLLAQTDFYNTDRGRPVQIEDAYVTERRALELKAAPVRLERRNGGTYSWGLEPEIAYGILPRTQVEIGVPIAWEESGPVHRAGLAGLELSAMHNLNVETSTWPALGVRADLLTPVGHLAPDRAWPSITGMATRTWQWARIHANAQYTAGASLAPERAGETGIAELSRWLAGAAIDRTFPLRSTLLTAELFTRQPIVSARDVEYTIGVGVRRQVSPSLALDGGVGRRLNGDAAGWYVTVGTAYAVGIASLVPGGR